MAYTPATINTTVSVTSATVPTVLIAPGFRNGMVMRARTGNTVAVNIWAYQGNAPVAAPSQSGVGNGVYELAAGNTYNDNLASAASGADGGLGDGYAGVLATGVTAMTVDVVSR